MFGGLYRTLYESESASCLGFPGDNILEIFKGHGEGFVQQFPVSSCNNPYSSVQQCFLISVPIFSLDSACSTHFMGLFF